jgi:hypothetical protein
MELEIDGVAIGNASMARDRSVVEVGSVSVPVDNA